MQFINQNPSGVCGPFLNVKENNRKRLRNEMIPPFIDVTGLDSKKEPSSHVEYFSETLEEHLEDIKDDEIDIQFFCKNDRTFKELMMSFVSKNKGIMAIYFMFLILYPVKNVLIPHLMGKLYGKVQENKPITQTLYLIVGILIFLQIAYLLAEWVEIKIHPLLQKHLMDEIIQHVFRINKENFNEQQVNQVISSVSKFPITCYNFISQLKSSVLPSVVGLLIIGIYLIFLNWKVGFLYVFMLVISFISVRFALRNCDDLSFNCDQQTTQLYDNLDDIIHNLSTIINFEKTDDELKNISNVFTNQKGVCKKTFSCTLWSKYCIIPIMSLFVIWSLTYFYKELKAKRMNAGTFISIIVVNFMIMNIVFNLTYVFKDMIIRMGIIKSSMKIFDECRIIPHYDSTKADFPSGIQFKNVFFSRFVEVKRVMLTKENKTDRTKVEEENDVMLLNDGDDQAKLIRIKIGDIVTYRKEKPIFKNLNVYFPKGKITLIMGKIGSGKSTLINLISKNQTILKGNIFIDGIPIQDIPHLKNKVFYVPQTPILFNRSIYDNINYGLEKEISPEEIIKRMREFGLSSFYDSLPNGLDSKVGLLGSNLSGGQRQMLWLIKLFFNDPEYIIMDEPTSAVDEDTKDLIHALIKNVSQNKTVIMITHDEYLRKLSDRIIHMKDGKVMTIEEK